MRDYSQEEKVMQALAPPAFSDGSSAFPAPRLQAEPPVDLIRFKESELGRLTAYGWVNREAGIAHIPIERAITIVASSGLPTLGSPTEKKPQASPASAPAAAGGKPVGSNAAQEVKP